MKVTPIARTIIGDAPESVDDTKFWGRLERDLGEGVSDADLLAEFSGRACYQAWHMPNPKTANSEGYIGNIISQGHFSVLEHSSVTFYVEGVSRALTHELVRHRHLSYSELSQRFVNVEDAEFVIPPAMKEVLDAEGMDYSGVNLVSDEGEFVELYNTWVHLLTKCGYTRKQAREAARAFMPNATETKIVVTGNLRAWRDVLGKRWHVAADAEIREFAGEVLEHLRDIAPASVQDIPTEPYGS